MRRAHPARAAGLLALNLLNVPPVRAQAAETFLQAAPLECAAAEALVVFGLLDGGPAADSTDLSALVGAGDGAACAAFLEEAGYGQGLGDPACMAAMGLVAAYGIPAAEGDPGALLHDILRGGEGRAGCVALLGAYDPRD